MDPFTTPLVVADPDRGRGAITLAVTPALKAHGVPSRTRLFQIPPKLKYQIAKPRMSLYIDYSARVYATYLQFFSPADIHVYSIDEAFIDISSYLDFHRATPLQLAQKVLTAIFQQTGLTATCGIGTNLYLAKIALDITAKTNQSHLATLTEQKFIATLGTHQPLTDFWGIGAGISKRLARHRLYTQNDIARANPTTLFQEFGINAQFLLDHARGHEPCTMAEIKAYRSSDHSLNNSQILFRDYQKDEALTVLLEMVEAITLRLHREQKQTAGIALTINYSKDLAPASSASHKLSTPTISHQTLTTAFTTLYNRITHPTHPIRQLSLTLSHLTTPGTGQLDLFAPSQTHPVPTPKNEAALTQAISAIKQKHGPNAILRAHSYKKEGTQRLRNQLIGGHNAH